MRSRQIHREARTRQRNRRTAAEIPDAAATVTTETDRWRILEVARKHFFAQGFQATTMDEIARDLGMSKKTLYQYFPSKEALLDGIIDFLADELAALLSTVLNDRQTPTTDKIYRMISGVTERLSPVQPVFLASLRRFAPRQFKRVEQLRRRNLETHLLPLLRKGQKQGDFRSGIEPEFMIEVILQTLHGMCQPEVCDRVGRNLAGVARDTLGLVFSGILRR